MSTGRSSATELPVLHVADAEAWAAWLDGNHASAPGVWLKLAKKASGLQSVSYVEAVEVALCYGWIDSQAKGYDASWSLQKFTPRGPRSIWSKINRARAEALIESGRMQAAGLTAIEKARRDGRWDAAYDSPATATVPPDLQAALDRNPAASDFFDTLNSANRFAILFRIQTAKKPETRARRIEQFVAMLERHEKIHA